MPPIGGFAHAGASPSAIKRGGGPAIALAGMSPDKPFWGGQASSGRISTTLSAPSNAAARSAVRSMLALPVSRIAAPLAKAGMNNPARRLASILPSVLKNRLPA